MIMRNVMTSGEIRALADYYDSKGKIRLLKSLHRKQDCRLAGIERLEWPALEESFKADVVYIEAVIGNRWV